MSENLEPTTVEERAFHLQTLDDIQPNADTAEPRIGEQSEATLIFPKHWIRMWLAFDRRLIADIDRLTKERDDLEHKAERDEAVQLARHVEPLAQALEGCRREHLVVEDCWYSCPFARDADGNSECCNDEAKRRGECTCGAARHNQQIDTALADLERTLEALGL